MRDCMCLCFVDECRCYVPDVAEAVAASALGKDAEALPPPKGLVTTTFKQRVR